MDLVSSYEDRYIKHPFVQEEANFEVRLIESQIKSTNTKSWCDVACGTGFHLRTAKGEVERLGVDISPLMIETYRHKTEYKVNYAVQDVLKLDTSKKYDLVTNFWFGYSHQDTLEEVLLFFNKMIDLTEKDGSIILSYHDQWSLFENIPQKTNEPMGGVFSFDALVWSYAEPDNPDCVYKCISPHIDLIKSTFEPHFKSSIILDYPKHKGRRVLLLEGKL